MNILKSMQRRIKRLYSKWTLSAIITLCSLWILLTLTGEFVWDHSQHPIDAVIYQVQVYFTAKDKQDLLFFTKDSKTKEETHAKPLSRIEVYLRGRITKIKQSCGDVCKTDQHLLINGMFTFSSI